MLCETVLKLGVIFGKSLVICQIHQSLSLLNIQALTQYMYSINRTKMVHIRTNTFICMKSSTKEKLTKFVNQYTVRTLL